MMTDEDCAEVLIKAGAEIDDDIVRVAGKRGSERWILEAKWEWVVGMYSVQRRFQEDINALSYEQTERQRQRQGERQV